MKTKTKLDYIFKYFLEIMLGVISIGCMYIAGLLFGILEFIAGAIFALTSVIILLNICGVE